MTIGTLKERFDTLDTDEVIQESFYDTKVEFETVQKQQLSAGKTVTGEPITPKYRSRKYASAKNEINSLPGYGTPDLKLTGAFYAGIDMEPYKDRIDIISKDDKGPELESKYPDIFGLGNDFKNKYLEEDLRPAVTGKISQATGLKFN